MRILTLFVAFAGAFCVRASGFAAPADPVGKGECVYPNPYAVLGEDVPGLDKVEFLSLPGPYSRPMRWLLISTDGPPDGGAYALACDGHTVAKLDLGYVVQTKLGPAVDGRDTLEVIYIPATGTGINLKSVALLQFDGKAIVKLWDHSSQDISTFPNHMYTGTEGDTRWRTVSDIYTWSYSPSALEISVGGIGTTEIEGSKAVHNLLPREKYCYRSETQHFERCN